MAKSRNDNPDLVIDSETGEIIENLAEMREAEADGELETDVTYLPKMTISTIEGVPERAVVEKKRVYVGLITGAVTGHKVVTMPRPDGGRDEYVALIGGFKAENYAGQKYRSGVCYLPAGFHEIVLERLDAVKANAARYGDPRGVSFALAIDAVPQANPRGYSYRGRSLTPVRKADPLEALWARTQAILAKPLLPTRAPEGERE